MGRTYQYEDDSYAIRVREEADGHLDFHLEIKRRLPPPVPSPGRPVGRGERVIVEANEHMRRTGTYEDDMVILDKGEGLYEVSSRTEPGAWHTVLVEGDRETCHCMAATYGRMCRHIKGVRTLLGRPVDAPLNSDSRAQSGLDFSLLQVEPSD